MKITSPTRNASGSGSDRARSILPRMRSRNGASSARVRRLASASSPCDVQPRSPLKATEAGIEREVGETHHEGRPRQERSTRSASAECPRATHHAPSTWPLVPSGCVGMTDARRAHSEKEQRDAEIDNDEQHHPCRPEPAHGVSSMSLTGQVRKGIEGRAGDAEAMPTARCR